MKVVTVVLLLFSLNAFAKLTATEALQLALPENEYEGLDPFSEQCTVDVIREQGQTVVKLWNTDTTTFLVVESAPYQFDQAQDYFTTSITTTSGTNTIELTFSTQRVSAVQRLVTFGRTFRNARGQQWYSAQKCTIDN